MDLPFQAFVHNGTDNDVGVGIDHVIDAFRGGGHVLKGHVLAAADVDHTALGAVNAG